MKTDKWFILLFTYTAIAGLVTGYIRFTNPDMTEMRLFLTYTKEIVVIVSIQVFLMMIWWRQS